MIQSASSGERCDGQSKEPISAKQQWLVDNLEKYVIQSKEKDEVILFEKDNIKCYCELEVSVNCFELILLGLTADSTSDTEQKISPLRRSTNLKKIAASLVEDVARHAIVVEYSPLDPKSHKGEDVAPCLTSFKVIDKEPFNVISENYELHFVPTLEEADGTKSKPIIRLVQSSLKRNIKRKKGKPKYPVYLWILTGPHKKMIIPPRHATDFYYRLLEGNVGYPLNYFGAAINDLVSQGIIEVNGKRIAISCEGAEIVERLFDRSKSKGIIYWKVRVGHKKNAFNR